MVKKIKVHVIDRDGRFEASPSVPENTTMRDFIQSMGKKFNLPLEGPISSGKKRGNYRYYQPINKRTGQILRGSGNDPKAGLNKTFAELGIKDGDTIKITEMIVGGADRERLKNDYKNLRSITKKAKKYITLEPQGNPPDFYVVKVRDIPGIMDIKRGKPVISKSHKLVINLKGNYPAEKPEIRFLTPIFHPYVFKNMKVCVTDGWSPAFSLDELFVEIINRIQCESPVFPSTVATPANSDALKWYRNNEEIIRNSIKPIPFPPDNGGSSPMPGDTSTDSGKTKIDWGDGKSESIDHNRDGIRW
jgi:ubiquitin-protein ligase